MNHFRRSILIILAMIILSIGILYAKDMPYFGEKYIPDIATFLQIGSTYSPHFCEATGDLYVVADLSGIDQVHRLNDKGWPYQLTAFEDGIDWYKVSPDGKKAVVGASTGGSEQAQLYLMDTQSGRLRQLTDNPKHRNGEVAWNSGSSGFYYHSNKENLRDFKFYYYDLATDSSSIIFDFEGSNYLGDLSLDDKFLIIEHAYSNVENDLYLIDLMTGKYERITPENAEYEYEYPSMSPDNKTVYVVTSNTKDGIRRIGAIDLASHKLTILNPEEKWTTDVLDFSENRRYMVWHTNNDGYSTPHMKDMETGEMVPVPDIKGRIKDIEPLNDGRLLMAYDSPTRTTDIWEWHPKAGQMVQKTFTTYAGINRDIFVEPQLIHYKSFDGLEIPAFLYLPPDYKGGPIPFILIAHGGPESQFRPYFVRNYQYFALNGFGILAPNPRGSTGYGKEYVDMDNYKNRINSVKDYKAAVDYLLSEGYSEKGKLSVMGGSYGGYVVLALITEYPDLFDAAINRVGIANFVTFLENTADYRRHIRESEYGPLEDKEFLISISPIHKAHLIKTPLLVEHGENDPRVPVSEAQQIMKAIQDNGGVVDSLIFSDEGHGIRKTENVIEAYRKIVEFLKVYIGK